MSRDAIKYVAMLTMLLNHVANIFLVPGTFWREFLVDLGYFTMPVMCYFLVEGFGYTRSRKRYGMRLAIFAALSELPFCLAFSEGAVISYVGMNMIFTLLLCFGMLVVMEAGWDENLKIFLVLALAALSWDSDWAIIAPLFTLLFYRAGGVEKRVRLAFLAGMGIFFADGLVQALEVYAPAAALAWSVGRMLGMALAAVVILYLYNGKRCARGRVFSKWFFYVFYPAHLLFLGMIRVALL